MDRCPVRVCRPARRREHERQRPARRDAGAEHVALYNYEDAPATPDADDPAIWLNRRNPKRSLLIATAKDAGLLVYDMTGVLQQALLPRNAPQVLPADPDTGRG